MNQQTVVLVGQPNVGKSALFNRLAGRTISIVHDQPGVTRDWISAPCPALGKDCAIVDTGGIGAEPDPDFARQTTAAARQAMEKADLIVLVVDGRMGMTPLDHELTRMLRAWGKSVFLAVNKIDTSKHDDFTSEFHGLGFSSVFPVSAAHGRGVGDLIEGIKVALKTEEATEEDVRPKDPHIALIGRPNAGKSSLVNRIFGEGRTIVSEIPGTTRDTVDISYTRKDEKGERTYIFCDTAGMRHRSRHRTPVEVFSTMRSEKAIRRADVCVLIMDVTEGVTAQDKKIGGLIQEAGKAAVIVLNKWDLVKWDGTAKDIRKKLFDSVREKLFFLPYAPILTLSAKSGESVSRLFSALDEIQENAKLTIGTGELNRLLKLAMERQPPPMKKNRRFKILYATQVDHSVERDFLPPEFIAFVNDLDLLDPGYAIYLERAIRATHAYPGLPIKFHFREREKKREVRIGN